MAIGAAPTQSSINNQATSIILNARNALQQIIFFNMYLQSLGADGLTGLGFATTDASSLLEIFEDLAAVAAMCNGSAYAGPTLPYNFLEATVPTWNGQ